MIDEQNIKIEELNKEKHSMKMKIEEFNTTIVELVEQNMKVVEEQIMKHELAMKE